MKHIRTSEDIVETNNLLVHVLKREVDVVRQEVLKAREVVEDRRLELLVTKREISRALTNSNDVFLSESTQGIGESLSAERRGKLFLNNPTEVTHVSFPLTFLEQLAPDGPSAELFRLLRLEVDRKFIIQTTIKLRPRRASLIVNRGDYDSRHTLTITFSPHLTQAAADSCRHEYIRDHWLLPIQRIEALHLVSARDT